MVVGGWVVGLGGGVLQGRGGGVDRGEQRQEIGRSKRRVCGSADNIHRGEPAQKKFGAEQIMFTSAEA